MCNYCVSSADAKDATAGKQIMSGTEWTEQFSMKSLLSLGKPLYIYGDYTKHYNRINKWVTDNGGKISGAFDIDAFSVEFLGTLPAGVVIVCEIIRHVPLIIKEIREKFNDQHILYDIHDLINYPHFLKCLSENNTVTNITCRFCPASKRSCGIRRNAMKLMPGEKTKVISLLAMKHGHQCNLKCKYCIEFMSTLSTEKRAFRNDEAIISLKKLSQAVEFIANLSLSGGEALLNPELPKLLDIYTALPNVGDMWTLTNGTYIPTVNVLDALEKHRDRICIFINDYEINKDASPLVEELSKRNITYNIRQNRGWVDGLDNSYHGRSVQELKQLYRVCCGDIPREDHYHIYTAGKISMKCAWASARLYALDKWDECRTDWIDILNLDVREVPDALTTLENKMYCDMCNYCPAPDGTKRNLTPAGDQLEK